MQSYRGFDINWDGSECLRITDEGFTVAINPSKSFSPEFSADIVLITSEEMLDTEKVEEVCGGRSCVVKPQGCGDVPCRDVEVLGDGEKVDIYGVRIEAVQSENGNSYLVEMNDTNFYFSCMDELSEQMFELENRVNLAFLPMGEEMDMEKVVKSAVRIKPDEVFPYRYSSRDRVNLKALKAELEDRNIGFVSAGEDSQ